jgi:uncharacterized membrane protein
MAAYLKQSSGIEIAASRVRSTPQAISRVASVDLLRGSVMVFMLLDHTREAFMNSAVNPTNFATTTPALFLTRWITYFCAPVFVFLAGTGAYLALARRGSKSKLSRFLLTRGLWLIVLEFTLSRWGLAFNFDYHFLWLLVLWTIGWCMIALAVLIYLPRWALALFSFSMIAGHNLLDGINAANLGHWSWLWNIVHQPGIVKLTSDRVAFVAYPLIPWIGVMGAGFWLGEILTRPAETRRRTLLKAGAAITLGFILLRALNLYGDPLRWKAQRSLALTICSFLNCQKYPPSLLFLMMTLGPALIFLAFADRPAPKWTTPIVVFGRVPMFYYLLQFPVAHVLAIALTAARGGSLNHFFAATGPLTPSPAGYGYGLGVVYAMWLLGLLLLYPACAWFSKLKQSNRSPWLSYL